MKIVIAVTVLSISFLTCKNSSDAMNKLVNPTVNNLENSTAMQNIDSVIYEASTRGFFEKIIIKKDSIFVTRDRSASEFTKVQLATENWKELISEIEKVGLKELEEFEAPSEMHQVDGAAVASFTVYTQDEFYETQKFDHKYPPKQLSGITDIIYELTK